jgi:hypothetical protein
MTLLPRSRFLRWLLSIGLALLLASMLIPGVQNPRPLRRLQPLEPDIIYEYATPPPSSAFTRFPLTAGEIAAASLALAAFAGLVHVAGRGICARALGTPTAWRFDLSLCVVGLALLLLVSGGAMRGLVAQLVRPTVEEESVVGYRYQIRSLLRKELPVRDFSEVALTRIRWALEDGHPQKAPADTNPHAPHSWQTLLLPHLYNFAHVPPPDLDLAWDAEANRGTFVRIVAAYINPEVLMTPADDARVAPYAPSHLAGNVHVLGLSRGLARDLITDGQGQTIVAGQVAANFAPWGKPGACRDPRLGINRSPDGFGSPGDTTLFLMSDGSVRSFSKDTDPAILRAMATPAGGER